MIVAVMLKTDSDTVEVDYNHGDGDGEHSWCQTCLKLVPKDVCCRKSKRKGLFAFKIMANLSKAFGKQLYIGGKVKREGA